MTTKPWTEWDTQEIRRFLLDSRRHSHSHESDDEPRPHCCTERWTPQERFENAMEGHM